MVKVIASPDWLVITCKGCQSLLQYSSNDLRAGSTELYGDIERFFYVTCPACSTQVVVYYHYDYTGGKDEIHSQADRLFHWKESD